MKWIRTKVLQWALMYIFKYIRVHHNSQMHFNQGDCIIEIKILARKGVNVHRVWETIMTGGIK